MNFKNKLIIYELNEVPITLIKKFISLYPNSTISSVLKKGCILETFSVDEGELHPWSTWPTVHRGVDNSKHKIKYINQNIREANNKFPPIWKILLKNKVDIGIFGSLQSFPPLKGKNVKFYVPDTFSPDPETYPKSLNVFQEFNLKMTNDNKAIPKKIDKESFFLFYKLLVSNKLSFISLAKIFLHLLKERFNKIYKKRRSLIQPLISFDIYFKELKNKNPSFTTFFSNHVAGMMHKYWKDLFSTNHNYKKPHQKLFNSNSIIEAMKIADRQIAKLKKYSDQNQYDLWVISSMGQNAIDRGDYIKETFLSDFNLLLKALKLDKENYELIPAMQPDICIKCNNKDSIKKLLESISKLRDKDNKQIIEKKYFAKGLSINLAMDTSASIEKNNNIISLNGKDIKLEDAGLSLIDRDQGTGYHIPEGILIAYGPNYKNIEKYKESKLDTRNIFKLILGHFNLKDS